MKTYAAKKTATQLNREIADALRGYSARSHSAKRHSAKSSRGGGRGHSTIQAIPEPEPSSDAMYMIAYDVLREYEPLKKLKEEKSPKGQELIRRFHKIHKEIRQKYPNAVPPAAFTKLYDKLTKPEKTYTQAQHDILNNLAANSWQMSPGLKIPHATSPNGYLRLWFKPQAVWFTKLKPGERGRHDFKDARTVSYTLDTRTQDPDTFRNSMERWSQE